MFHHIYSIIVLRGIAPLSMDSKSIILTIVLQDCTNAPGVIRTHVPLKDRILSPATLTKLVYQCFLKIMHTTRFELVKH